MNFDRILPILIALVSHVADLKEVLARVFELIVHKRISEEEVV